MKIITDVINKKDKKINVTKLWNSLDKALYEFIDDYECEFIDEEFKVYLKERLVVVLESLDSVNYKVDVVQTPDSKYWEIDMEYIVVEKDGTKLTRITESPEEN
jgi:hypothetical protein